MLYGGPIFIEEIPFAVKMSSGKCLVSLYFYCIICGTTETHNKEILMMAPVTCYARDNNRRNKYFS